jgi:hypothetical protein
MSFSYSPFGTLPLLCDGVSRAINAENPTGEKGRGGTAASNLGVGRKGSPCLRNIASGQTVTLGRIDGCGVITHMWMTVRDQTDAANRYVLRDLVLRIYWDGETTPSVEAPLGDFFCLGFGESYTVNSALVNVNPLRGMNCFFQMPFFHSAHITLENQHPNPISSFFYQIDYCLYPRLPENTACFHAQFRRERLTQIGRDYVVLDGVRGRGHYIGTFMALSTLERYWWGEGEFKFYLDGDGDYPTICGTGQEDYFGGAWSFATHDERGDCIETPFQGLYMGYPFYKDKDTAVTNRYHNRDVPPMRAFYRWHVYDPIRFERDLRLTVQQIGVCHGGLFERQDDMASVAYWYQAEPHAAFPPLPDARTRHPR